MEANQDQIDHPAPSRASKPIPANEDTYRVEKQFRTSRWGDHEYYRVVRERDGFRDEVFNTWADAVAHCEQLHARQGRAVLGERNTLSESQSAAV